MLTDETIAVKTRRIRRIYSVFLLGIVVPAGFLTFWGFRSFQYERLLMEKQSEERFASTANLVEKKVSEQISGLKSALQAVALDDNLIRLDIPKSIPTVLEVKSLGGLPVVSAFVFNGQDQMIIPWSSTGFPKDAPVARAPEWGAFREEAARADHLEFIDHDYAQTAKTYKELESQVGDASPQAVVLKNLAGCYRKQNQDRLAEATYLKLKENDDHIPDFSGYPMGVLALRCLRLKGI